MLQWICNNKCENQVLWKRLCKNTWILRLFLGTWWSLRGTIQLHRMIFFNNHKDRKQVKKNPQLRNYLSKQYTNNKSFMVCLVFFTSFVLFCCFNLFRASFIELYTSFQGWLDNDTDGKSIRSNRARFLRYLNSFWNWVDVLSYIFLVAAMFVRHLRPSEEYNAARRMFSLSLLVMYLRFLEAFLVYKRSGTTVIMIKEMVTYTKKNTF